jgi:hypothetical protein
MPQLHAGVLYGVPALMAGQIVLSMAEQIPAPGRWFGFAAGLLGTVGVMLMARVDGWRPSPDGRLAAGRARHLAARSPGVRAS